MSFNYFAEKNEKNIKAPCFNVVLYEPEIAANVGAVGRTCVGLGAKLWLVEPLGFQIDDRKLKRAGLDYWQFLNWEIASDWDACLSKLAIEKGVKESELRLFFFSKKAERSYLTETYRRGDVFIFGSESCGLPEKFVVDKSRALRIPTRGEIRSLNLSVSVAVVGFEAIRQLGAEPENK